MSMNVEQVELYDESGEIIPVSRMLLRVNEAKGNLLEQHNKEATTLIITDAVWRCIRSSNVAAYSCAYGEAPQFAGLRIIVRFPEDGAKEPGVVL